MVGKWGFWERVETNNGTKHCSPESLHKMPGAALPVGIGGPCASKQGLLGENCQPGAATVLLKNKQDTGGNQRETERKNHQDKWKEREFWSQTHLQWNHGYWMVFTSHLTSLTLSFLICKMKWQLFPKFFVRNTDEWGNA